MTVHVLKGELAFVSDWHQFNHTVARVAGNARAFIELRPTEEITLNALGDTGNAARKADSLNDSNHIVGTEIKHGKEG
jgi:hypothetical protein